MDEKINEVSDNKFHKGQLIGFINDNKLAIGKITKIKDLEALVIFDNNGPHLLKLTDIIPIHNDDLINSIIGEDGIVVEY